ILDEYLKKETRFTQIFPNRYIEFTMVNWFFRLFIPRLSFQMDPSENGCLFTATVVLRGFGPIGKWAHRKEFIAVKQHMKEEGQNLKRIIERRISQTKKDKPSRSFQHQGM
ncbi:MAG: hypothetical protein AAFV07_18145, partial [Bacteroidota bacterium]